MTVGHLWDLFTNRLYGQPITDHCSEGSDFLVMVVTTDP